MTENKIKILSQSLSNKIAAGEVVNRPESVVKELIENSLDSGAGNITLIIKDAGKSLIQVNDDGSGMIEEDAVLSFQRHSTSKISRIEDLENILTLGFRGEALASIASISHVELKSRTADSDVGTLVKLEGGEIKETAKTSCEKGTSIAVRNLFYNTPGRRNFLKSDQTEFRHIYESFVRLALSNPGTAFTFFNNDTEVFNLKPSDLKTRISELFGDKIPGYLLDVENGNEIIKVKGFISKPNFTKKSKQDQYFYLNGRFFQSRSLNYAVYSGFDHLIEKGDYPSFFLFIDILPGKVDVNVHPSKMEVKFEDEGAVFGFLRNSVKEALRKSDLVFDIGFDNTISFPEKAESFHYKNDRRESQGFSGGNSAGGNSGQRIFSGNESGGRTANIHSIFEAARKDDKENIQEIPEVPAFDQNRIFEHSKKSDSANFNVWQYQMKYIMCQTETGLMIIDQHAAHERILYERASLWLDSQSSFSQQLLIPIRVKLTKIDYHIAESLKDEFRNLGFNLNLISDDIIELTGLPSDVKIGDESRIFQDLIDQFKEYELKLNLEKRDNLAKSFACRSAIKSGDKLTFQEMTSLIDDLFASKMPYVCPHGRPTLIRITTEELDKRFSRT
ncbi:MAG: DNA mismatch repair endonuclease MutL [Bacteroidetes bacterium]|nr:DNA mismatch repair endonuclease MutL [Bacteroidota bacterium]